MPPQASPQTPLRLTWKATGLGNPDDYTGKDLERPHAYCRIYRDAANSGGQPWRWTASDGHVDLGSGYADDARHAAALAEAAYWPRRGRAHPH